MEDPSAGGFECQCDEEFRSACKDLTLYGEYEGKQYCVLHYPSEKKTADTEFQEALQKKKQDKDFDFSGVYFPSTLTEFKDFEFKTPALFSGATFSGDASFYGSFSGATFSDSASFYGATFSGASFDEATFSGEAYFNGATFSERASFYDLKTLPETLLSLAGATIEKPERISFHTTYLRPSGFVDVDAQKFDFSDVEWFRLPSGEALTIEAEAKVLADKGIEPPGNLRKLQKACRRLMNNSEDNRDYPTANKFHYWSMEAQRKEGWRRLGWGLGLVTTLYWFLSGYGEKAGRAFSVLLGMWVLFADSSRPGWIPASASTISGIHAPRSYSGKAYTSSSSRSF